MRRPQGWAQSTTLKPAMAGSARTRGPPRSSLAQPPAKQRWVGGGWHEGGGCAKGIPDALGSSEGSWPAHLSPNHASTALLAEPMPARAAPPTSHRRTPGQCSRCTATLGARQQCKPHLPATTLPCAQASASKLMGLAQVRELGRHCVPVCCACVRLVPTALRLHSAKCMPGTWSTGGNAGSSVHAGGLFLAGSIGRQRPAWPPPCT